MKQKFTLQKEKNKNAYSLIELSIVIVIISILISGAMSVSVSSVNNAKVKTSKDRINEIYKAIGNFLLTNKRLPCPAAINTTKTGSSNYGDEVGAGSNCAGTGVYQSTTNTNLVYGMIPVKALGLTIDMAEDGFESKFTYIIDKRFTNACDLVNPNFSTITFCTSPFTSIITVNEKFGSITQQDTADAIISIISHGSNKAGAYNANSSTRNSRSNDQDEQNNDINDSNNFDNILVASSSASDVFDDVVFFKRRNDFIEDFKAMFMIPCNISEITGFGTSSVIYGETVYATSSCANPNTDKRLTKKCEAYGNWVDIVAACP
jgi:prepilin-type N-terminal cleavage/methylation domain-containing protein